MNRPTHSPNTFRNLAALGIVSTAIYAWITWLSGYFYSVPKLTDRPLLAVLILFGAAFLAYLLGCCEIWKRQPEDCDDGGWKKTLWMIVGFGILFRAIMVFSIPIQEIDLYRYILDGAISNAGGDPYEYAPMEIKRAVDAAAKRGLAAVAESAEASESTPLIVFARPEGERRELERLASLIATRPGLRQCLEEIHYGEYTTPYPPVSQAVFRVATLFVPDQASGFVWLVSMKATLTLLEILTGLMLIGLLRHCGLPGTISLVYWWCPLLIKEIANSGHLDSIAVCLSVGFAWMAVASFWPSRSSRGSSSGQSFAQSFALPVGAAAMLGLAVAAKVYPLVLAPAWAICLIRRKGIAGMLPVIVFVGVATWCMWPLLQRTSLASRLELTTVNQQADDGLVQQMLRDTEGSGLRVLRRPDAGIEAFSKYWEMNDLIFMFIVENVRPGQPADATAPWFLVTTEKWRTNFANDIAQRLGWQEGQFAFQFTRIVTLLAYVVLTALFCVMAWRTKTAVDLLNVFFLSVAWFWMLAPTQNPWYWLWALPFVVFVKRPLPWLLLSGTLFLYYLRFYFQHHYGDAAVAGTAYVGTLFFDFVIPWIEFAPIFLLLLMQTLSKKVSLST